MFQRLLCGIRIEMGQRFVKKISLTRADIRDIMVEQKREAVLYHSFA
jgi:hypothetical protein